MRARAYYPDTKWVISNCEPYQDSNGRFYDLYTILSLVQSIEKFNESEERQFDDPRSPYNSPRGTIIKKFEVKAEVGKAISDYLNNGGYSDIDMLEYLTKLFGK